MRIREIDFLRGCAILLVLFRHHPFTAITKQIGWVGVDLFFVLSGFLVSGLLFKEYQRFGDIKPGLFLIRRGFKIYPLFYLAILATILMTLLLLGLEWTGLAPVAEWDVAKWFIQPDILIAESFFFQNYYGYHWEHTWSLAVEEHFYIALALVVYLLSRKGILAYRNAINWIFAGIALLCLAFRIQNHFHYASYTHLTHLFQSHLRFDSLFFGVFLSYQYHFHREDTELFFRLNRSWLAAISGMFMLLPFFFECSDVFMNTIGLSLLYLGFGTILMLFLTSPETNDWLDRILTKRVADLISRIGFYSYGIYLWHMFVQRYAMRFIHKLMPIELHYRIEFVIYFLLSIIVGIYISKWVEQPFLGLRDRRFPRRAAIQNLKQLM